MTRFFTWLCVFFTFCSHWWRFTRYSATQMASFYMASPNWQYTLRLGGINEDGWTLQSPESVRKKFLLSIDPWMKPPADRIAKTLADTSVSWQVRSDFTCDLHRFHSVFGLAGYNMYLPWVYGLQGLAWQGHTPLINLAREASGGLISK